MSSTSSTGYRGVTVHKDGIYGAQIHVNHKDYTAGRWLTAREAAIAFDRAALFLGHPGPLNLPRISRKLGPLAPDMLRWEARRQQRQRATRPGATPRLRTAKYVGVIAIGSGWQGTIPFQGRRRVSTGTFADQRAAAVARERVLVGLACKDLSLRNFPNETFKPATLAEARSLGARASRRERKGMTAYVGVVHRTNERLWAPWQASFRVGDVQHFLGSWHTQKKAALAYDRAALYYAPETLTLNFPKQAPLLQPATAAALRREAHTECKQHTTSRYRGVSWSKNLSRWEVHIKAERVRYSLGSYDDEQDAGRAYDRAARRLHGKRARLNFPRGA